MTAPMRLPERQTEHDRLRIMIEDLQRTGHNEAQITSAIRRARTRRPRRPSRLRAFDSRILSV
jgi:hypothetical protein